jgi:transcriptional regulator
MERRNFLAGMAALELTTEASVEAADSVYIPDSQKVTDVKALQDLMEEFSFADLITSAGGIRVTHLPVLLDRTGKFGKLTAHVAKNNPQQALLDGTHEAVLVFHGPHHYISPSWYVPGTNAVPTWNFAVVHATGKPKALNDDARTAAFLERLVGLPESYKKGMRQGIVAFEMEIESLEGKFKLGLDRAANVPGMLKGLRASKGERSLVEFTEAELKRRG